MRSVLTVPQQFKQDVLQKVPFVSSHSSLFTLADCYSYSFRSLASTTRKSQKLTWLSNLCLLIHLKLFHLSSLPALSYLN